MASRAEPAEDALHWLALKLTPGLGTRLAARLVGSWGHPREIFRRSPGDLEAQGVAPVVARTLGHASAFEEAQRELERLQKAGATLVTYSDPEYPDLLRQIFDPPVVLYARGDCSLLAKPAVSVVGARKPSPYGLAVAERLASDLAMRGVAIVSGLARGVDTAAHRGALAGGGRTVAVLGCGIDQCYPSENRRLKAQIEERGLVISEFPMGAFAAPQNFPIRNRVISGIGYGVVVVEAAQYSGSLITARLAMEQNREVFCVPGNVTNKLSWGPNTLIKQGSKLVQDWRDVVDELPAAVRQAISLEAAAEPPPAGGQAPLFEQLTEIQRAVEKLLKVEEALHIDAILELLPEQSPSEILAALLELEIGGRIRQLPGKNYVKGL